MTSFVRGIIPKWFCFSHFKVGAPLCIYIYIYTTVCIYIYIFIFIYIYLYLYDFSIQPNHWSLLEISVSPIFPMVYHHVSPHSNYLWPIGSYTAAIPSFKASVQWASIFLLLMIVSVFIARTMDQSETRPSLVPRWTF